MDIGCGAGTSTRALVGAGFETVAIEPSAAFLEIARKDAPEATFVNASVYDVDIPSCDAVIAIGEPLTYHDPDADAPARLCRLFRRVSEALSPEGVLIFDMIVVGDETLANKTWLEEDDWAVLAETTEDRATGSLARRIVTFRKHGGHFRRNNL